MPRLSTVVLSVVALLFVVFIVGIVTSSLTRPEVDTYVPTSADPEEVGAAIVAPRMYTVDASAHDRWVYFDFSRGSVVEVSGRGSLDWDIAFQRHRMMTNGGSTNPRGLAGVADLGALALDAGLEAPDSGYATDEQRGDTPRNRVLEDWYDYSWTTHILKPADRLYALRTADGRFALLRFVGYYCPGGRPGCVSFRYRYRGDGGRSFPSGEAASESLPGS